jgi:FkbM family methyltransferase
VRGAKGTIKRLALRCGVLVRKLPAGRQADPFRDQAALLRGREVRTVFDVGAYVGETALQYRSIFPHAQIHCFEPVPDSFQKLSDKTAGDRRITLNQGAVGAAAGSLEIHVNRSPFTSSTLRPAKETATYIDPSHFEQTVTHQAKVVTVDDYCAEHGIDEIDVLKLDIQGAELAALNGASRMLSRAAIQLVYTEMLVAPMYDQQSRLGEVLNLYEGYGYWLYGLYNLAYGADTRLYQMDAIVVAPSLPLT